MSGDREQDLEQTDTVVASEPAVHVDDSCATLGVFRLERKLGAGAMGVVYAAFDPELARRIAIKVLRSERATNEAKQRLLREARAMARLTHPNVVTVYEVGVANGRDFVAMELIHGETLTEWLRKRRPARAAILDAFLAAGRGLAAAHAAGIVHRDFKPRNVLRSHGGRIVVTDFGLARDVNAAAPLVDDMARSAGEDVALGSPELTATGALLGTPPYMAPEQWRGGEVTAATDQFAYCVALWESLAGQRPYRGRTLEDLRRQIARGPTSLDVSRIPRWARGLLHRGLDPDPARRWPNMDALLARLAAARRRRPIARVAAAMVAIAAALGIALRPGQAPTLECEPPRLDVARVWSPAIEADLRAKASEAHAAVLEAAYARWSAIRGAACSASPKIKPAQLHCLDGVLERFDALRQAFASSSGGSVAVMRGNLVDADVCRSPSLELIPRLTLWASPSVITALVLLGRSETEHKPSEAELTALAGASDADPCARVIAALAFEAASGDVPRIRSLLTNAAGPAEQCGDERLRADLRIKDAWYRFEMPMVGPRGEAAIEQAQIAAAHVMQPELEAALAMQRVFVARQRGNWDEAFRLVNTALEHYRARGQQVRQLRAVLTRNDLRRARAEPGDLEAIIDDARTWRPLGIATHRNDLLHRLDTQGLAAKYWLGDVAAAHAELVRLWLATPQRPVLSRKITGDVVDLRGRPVAGATVAAASNLYADSVGIDLPGFAVSDSVQNDLRVVTSDRAGHFAIEDAAPVGAMAAELGALRSMPSTIADHVRLVLEPTRRISGKVDLAGLASTRVSILVVAIGAATSHVATIAPVAEDGSFTIMGVPTRAVRISAIEAEPDAYVASRMIPGSLQPATGVALSLAPSTRALDVIVRSTVDAELGGAKIIVASGKQKIVTPDEIWLAPVTQTGFARQANQGNLPESMRDKTMPGDLAAQLEHVATGDLTVCAVNFSGDWLDSAFRARWPAHFRAAPFRCEYVGARASFTVIRLPPQQRFDGQ